MKKKKKDKSIRQDLPPRVWEDEVENISRDVEKDEEEEDNEGSNYNPFAGDGIEGE